MFNTYPIMNPFYANKIYESDLSYSHIISPLIQI